MLISVDQDDLEYFDDSTMEQMLEDVDCVDETIIGPFSVFRAQALGATEVDTDLDASTLGYDDEVSRHTDVISVYRSPILHIAESPHLDLSSPLYRNPQAGMLMHHYANFITNLLQPIQHDGNIYRRVYIPNAIAGSTDLIMGVSNQDSKPSSIAMFHALLSASAFHLRMNTAGQLKKSYNQMGLLHKAKAYQNLQVALADPSKSDHESTLNAMLAMITIDVSTITLILGRMQTNCVQLMDGAMKEFPIHLKGFRHITNDSLIDLSTLTPSLRKINIVYRFLRTLAGTSDYNLPALRWIGPVDIFDTSPFRLDDTGTLEFTYGTTATLATLIYTITRFAQFLSNYSISETPKSLAQACSDLGECIASWTLATELFPAVQYKNHDNRALVQHSALAFYYAAKLYYHRRISLCSETEFGEDAQNVADNLLIAEAIKETRFGSLEQIMAPLSWTGFIASCEALPSQREVWQTWWAKMLSYGIGFLHRLWDVVNDIWQARDLEGENFGGWYQYLKDHQIQVLII